MSVSFPTSVTIIYKANHFKRVITNHHHDIMCTTEAPSFLKQLCRVSEETLSRNHLCRFQLAEKPSVSFNERCRLNARGPCNNEGATEGQAPQRVKLQISLAFPSMPTAAGYLCRGMMRFVSSGARGVFCNSTSEFQ